MQLPLNSLVLDVQLLRGDGEENERERKGAGLLNPLKITLGRGGGHIEIIDISPGNLDSNLCFLQSSISHDVLCI